VEFKGSGADEVAIDTATGRTVMRLNPRFLRPAEVDLLIGDASLARDKLGWQAQTTLEELCAMMVAADLRRCERGVSF
jgi:GDPmannose 4,6-dehydratase